MKRFNMDWKAEQIITIIACILGAIVLILGLAFASQKNVTRYEGDSNKLQTSKLAQSSSTKKADETEAETNAITVQKDNKLVKVDDQTTVQETTKANSSSNTNKSTDSNLVADATDSTTKANDTSSDDNTKKSSDSSDESSSSDDDSKSGSSSSDDDSKSGSSDNDNSSGASDNNDDSTSGKDSDGKKSDPHVHEFVEVSRTKLSSTTIYSCACGQTFSSSAAASEHISDSVGDGDNHGITTATKTTYEVTEACEADGETRTYTITE